MEPERGSDYAPNEWAFDARNRLNRVFFASVSQELEEANIHPNYEEYWHEEGDFFCGVPASNKAILGLHVPRVGETKEHYCTVCLEDFMEGDKLRMMPCSHSFHQRCIFEWLHLSGVCPCCRFALPSVHEQHFLDKQATRVQEEVSSNG